MDFTADPDIPIPQRRPQLPPSVLESPYRGITNAMRALKDGESLWLPYSARLQSRLHMFGIRLGFKVITRKEMRGQQRGVRVWRVDKDG